MFFLVDLTQSITITCVRFSRLERYVNNIFKYWKEYIFTPTYIYSRTDAGTGSSSQTFRPIVLTKYLTVSAVTMRKKAKFTAHHQVYM